MIAVVITEPSSEAADVDDGFGESLRSLLRQVVPDAALDDPMLVFAGEFAGVGAGVRVRRTVGVSLQGDGGDRDGRKAARPRSGLAVAMTV
jgi:hypothetical protein